MSREPRGDAVVVGAGPNGLAAAIVLAQAGLRPVVLEAGETIGGGARSAELTNPGFVHDVCSAVHPLLVASPFLSALPLAEHGLEMVHPGAPLAHPLDGGDAVLLERSIAVTADGLGPDGGVYSAMMRPLASAAEALTTEPEALLRSPRHMAAALRFTRHAPRSARGFARTRFVGPRARALFAGAAAHSMLALETRGTAMFGLALCVLGHAAGWPVARGGSQRIADALAGHLVELGGELVTSHPVSALEELPPARLTLLDLTPRQLVAIAGDRLPAGYRRGLRRYRYGPGAFKVDWALSDPIPWRAAEARRAGTLHLGGTIEEIAASEGAAWRGEHPELPFVILAQQSLFDSTRAPRGAHTAWAYCHVPNGSAVDMTERIEAQVERFAPGFRDYILARHAMPPPALERYNANYVGGDINGGAQDLRQMLARPVPKAIPYATPLPGVYLCSSSTPPGGGVHGMCGYLAAKAALRREHGRVAR